MKKRFLLAALCSALAFTGNVLPPTCTANAANLGLSADVIQEIQSMDRDKLIQMLEYMHSSMPDYYPESAQDASILQNNGAFMMDGSITGNGIWVLWLNPAEEEILRQRFPDIFKDVSSPIGLDAGEDAEDVIVNYAQVKDDPSAESGIAPDFDKVLAILERGPYTIDVASKISTNCTGNATINKKYTVTATYEATASDGGDFEISGAYMSISYNKNKPTKLQVHLICANENQLTKTLTLKIPKKLQKQIKTGQVIITGTNAYTNGKDTEMSVYKANIAKSGKISLNFKFKTKK